MNNQEEKINGRQPAIGGPSIFGGLTISKGNLGSVGGSSGNPDSVEAEETVIPQIPKEDLEEAGSLSSEKKQYCYRRLHLTFTLSGFCICSRSSI